MQKTSTKNTSIPSNENVLFAKFHFSAQRKKIVSMKISFTRNQFFPPVPMIIYPNKYPRIARGLFTIWLTCSLQDVEPDSYVNMRQRRKAYQLERKFENYLLSKPAALLLIILFDLLLIIFDLLLIILLDRIIVVFLALE